MNITAMNPFRCRVWSLHARLDENLTEESCKTEIESFEKHGQLVPTLGRRLRNDPDYDVELIFGSRRLFVARHLNLPLLVEVRDVSDRDGIIAMDLENRLRTDISAYERGSSYVRWLQDGHFGSQDEIAKSLRISASQVSRLLKLARLPAAVVEAFGNPIDICEGWGAELANLLDDAERQRHMMQAARAIAAVAPRPPPREVYKQLCVVGREDHGAQAAPRIVKDEAGEELYRVKRQRGSIVVIVSLDILSKQALGSIERSIARFMDPKLCGKLIVSHDDVDAREEDIDAGIDIDIDMEMDIDSQHGVTSEPAQEVPA